MRGLLSWPWLLLLLVVTLVAVGVTFIESSTRGTRLDGLAMRQLMSVGVALPFAGWFALVPLRKHARHAVLWYVGILIALTAVLFVGLELHGARRWFRGPLGFLIQPSELAKPICVLVWARWLAVRRERGVAGTLTGMAVWVTIPFLLVRAEPDLGTALMLPAIAAGMLYGMGLARTWFLAAVVVAVLGANAAVHSSLLADYQKDRIRVFTYSIPERSAEAVTLRREGRVTEAAAIEQEIREIKRNSGYQGHTAQTSIGTGGTLGKGLGEGPQNRLGYLPERHNDFVFAVVAEETGFVGCLGLLLLYGLVAASILQVAATTREPFARAVACGAATALTVQAGCNIGMTVGLLPITGLPLPFISQGGSSMMSSLALVGLVVSAARDRACLEPFRHAAAGPPPDPFGAHTGRLHKRLRLH